VLILDIKRAKNIILLYFKIKNNESIQREKHLILTITQHGRDKYVQI
jgi:hypothetical protein